MKRFTIIFIAFLFMLMQGTLQAKNKWNDTKGIFKFQKDLDKSVSKDYTRTMATISLGQKLLNFVNYRVSGDLKGKIIIRTLYYDDTKKNPWSHDKKDKKDKIPELSGLGDFDWQPAPVFFNNQLYLFVGDKSKGISYSVYNDGGDSWDPIKSIDASKADLGCGMAATVVDGKLCLVTIKLHKTYNWMGDLSDEKKEIVIYWTEDLITWQTQSTGLYSKAAYIDTFLGLSTKKYNNYNQLSAISTTFVQDGIKKAKLVFGYINNKFNPHTAEYYFDDSNSLIQISEKLITTDDHSSIVLAEGTVMGDDDSNGRCVQAFLKRKDYDNGWRRIRIERYQSFDGGDWTRQEKNLVPQNTPQKMWASDDINLSAAVMPVPDGDSFTQYMCLVYRGYDDFDFPLNCAWVETNYLEYVGHMSKILNGAKNSQYVGYIEGPPPFYLNDKNQFKDDPDGAFWNSRSFAPISQTVVEIETSESSDEEIGYHVGGSLKFQKGLFHIDASYSFGQKYGTEYKKTISNGKPILAKNEALGTYIIFRPRIDRAEYNIIDVHKKLVGTTYYFYITDVIYDTEDVVLQYGIEPGNPSTYVDNRGGVPFTDYHNSKFGSNSTTWAKHEPGEFFIEIEKEESKTNTHDVEVKVGFGKEESMFNLDFNGSFEYSLTTTTGSGSKISCFIDLNDPVDQEDAAKLNFTAHWLLPRDKPNDWWLHDSAKTQDTWCLAYEVTEFRRENGSGFGNVSEPLQDENNNLSSAIVKFTVGQTQTEVILNWQTLTEKDNYGFEIVRLRSPNYAGVGATNEWETIGFVEGAENSDSPKEYSFIDSKPLIGKSIYRLKQVNKEGNFVYSSNVEVEVEQLIPTEFALEQNYPNPFNPTTNISFTVPTNGHAVLRVFNTLGQEVAQLFNGEAQAGIKNQVAFNASHLSSGTYFSRLEYDGKVLLKKMLLIK